MHSFAMTAVGARIPKRGAWINSQLLPQPGFSYVSAKWESSTTCLTVGNSSQSSAVLRSTDSGRTWTDVTNNNNMQNFVLTDIAFDEFYVVTGRNPDGSSPIGVVYTSNDGVDFGLGFLVSPGAGLNGAAVGYNNMNGWTACVVGVLGKIYRSYYDLKENDFISWADVSPIRMTVMRSLR